MSGRLIESLATTSALAALFSDESLLEAMLDFEAALARAEARSGVIPKDAADVIAAAARTGNFDISALADASFRAGTPAIPLVIMLTDQVRKTDVDAARFVHWGATSQDVADTAMSLLLKRAEPILREAQRQRHAWKNSASTSAACHLRTESRRMVSIGLPRQAASSESVSSCGGSAGWRSQRNVGVAWGTRHCDSSSSKRRPWIRIPAGSSLAHAA
jgi:Lyase